MMKFGWILLIALMTAWMLTGSLRRYVLASCLIDVANARSSHQVPSPRGGGLSLLIAVINVCWLTPLAYWLLQQASYFRADRRKLA